MEPTEETIKQAIIRAAESQIPYQGPECIAPIQHIDIGNEKRIFYNALLDVEPDFDIKKADPKILNSIIAWVWRKSEINSLALDYNKGLFFYGSLGRGKTMTLLALRKYLIDVKRRFLNIQNLDYRLGTYWKSASELANIYAADGQPALELYYAPDCCLFIDEIGREPNPANNFGTKLDVIQFLMQMRYNYRRTSVTHITTNLALDQIADKYGVYIADRCLELFNFVEFRGESIRH